MPSMMPLLPRCWYSHSQPDVIAQVESSCSACDGMHYAAIRPNTVEGKGAVRTWREPGFSGMSRSP